MIQVYERQDCPFCWKLRLALEELRLSFSSVKVNFGDKHPDVLRMNPKGSVPVMVDAGVVIWESSVAVEYINSQYGEGQLLKGDAASQAEQRLLVSFSDSVVGPALRDLVFEKRSRPQAEWDIEKIQRSNKAWTQCLDQLELWLEDKAFFSEGFSIVECALLPRFGIAKAYGAGVDERHPGLSRWFVALEQRSSYRASYPGHFMGLNN